MSRWITVVLLVFALHFGWEMMQGGWFANMKEMPFWSATLLCLHATAGDLLITTIAYAAVAVGRKRLLWPIESRAVIASTAFMVIGIAVTAAYEVFATFTGRWRYDARMPTLFGVGVLPLLQWLVVPAAELLLFRLIWRDALALRSNTSR